MTQDVLQGYADAASSLIPRFEAISPEILYAPVIDLFPVVPSRIADVGAGTGRDAAWLAGKGHGVLAVEPVAALRCAGMDLHRASSIEWLDDRLPDLAHVEGTFDCVLLSAVWQHLDDRERRSAMHRLAWLTAPRGVVIMSLRHGVGAPGRPVHDAAPEDTVRAAEAEGFTILRRDQADSVQAGNRERGVYWTWLVFGFL